MLAALCIAAGQEDFLMEPVMAAYMKEVHMKSPFELAVYEGAYNPGVHDEGEQIRPEAIQVKTCSDWNGKKK
ncbi:hypothetical protein WJX72_003260 [[Myrmecia] bisecta]|uniref:Uncharacterized protein n=1 Tax=[Myrmecia] bisecta TaxID=41462 RepID=A0AAW1P293_9CHLO